MRISSVFDFFCHFFQIFKPIIQVRFQLFKDIICYALITVFVIYLIALGLHLINLVYKSISIKMRNFFLHKIDQNIENIEIAL